MQAAIDTCSVPSKSSFAASVSCSNETKNGQMKRGTIARYFPSDLSKLREVIMSTLVAAIVKDTLSCAKAPTENKGLNTYSPRK